MIAALVLAAAAASSTVDTESAAGVQSMIEDESPEVFLAKATLQQYLSRVVRQDWDGARRLTHPRTLAVIRDLKQRIGSERHNLAPWANREAQLKTFRFRGARQIAPGIVAVQVGEDSFRVEEHGMSMDDAAVYLLFKSRGGFLVADKKADAQLGDISDQSVRIGYPGYADGQAQARREATLRR